MVTATAEDILGIFEELNFPSATKLRAALIKRGFKARLKDVEEIVKSQTPTQMFAKAPKYETRSVQVDQTSGGWSISLILQQNPAAAINISYWFKTFSLASFGLKRWKTKT